MSNDEGRIVEGKGTAQRPTLKFKTMKSKLKSGVCVSCGRASGRYYRECPYCGEQVWQPGWRRAVSGLLIAAPPLLAAALAWRARAGLAEGVRALGELSAASALLLAAGAGLVLSPCSDDDLTVSSQRELARWQAQAVCGGALSGLYALAGAVCASCGPGGAGTWLAAAALAACVGAAPLFFRIPWRATVASAMIAAAVALG